MINESISWIDPEQLVETQLVRDGAGKAERVSGTYLVSRPCLKLKLKHSRIGMKEGTSLELRLLEVKVSAGGSEVYIL